MRFRKRNQQRIGRSKPKSLPPQDQDQDISDISDLEISLDFDLLDPKDAAKVRLIKTLELEPGQEWRVYKLIEGPIKMERLWAGVFPTYPSYSEIWGQVQRRFGGGRYVIYAKRPRPRFIKSYHFNAPEKLYESEEPEEERSLIKQIIDRKVVEFLERDPELMHEVVAASIRRELNINEGDSEELTPEETLKNDLFLNDPEVREALRQEMILTLRGPEKNDLATSLENYRFIHELFEEGDSGGVGWPAVLKALVDSGLSGDIAKVLGLMIQRTPPSEKVGQGSQGNLTSSPSSGMTGGSPAPGVLGTEEDIDNLIV